MGVHEQELFYLQRDSFQQVLKGTTTPETQ